MGSMLRCNALFFLLAVTALSGCASGPKPRNIDPAKAIEEAREVCKVLINSRLKAPISTDIGPLMRKAQSAKKGGKLELAATLAEDLTSRCEAENLQREELAQVANEVHLSRNRLDPKLYNRFMALAVSGHYTEAIHCGDGLVSGRPDNCRDYRIQTPAKRSTSIRLEDPTLKEAFERKDTSAQLNQEVADAHRKAQTGQDADRGEELPPDMPAKDGGAVEEKGRFWTWILLGAGGGMLITGGVLAGLAQEQYNELDKTCPNCIQEDIDKGSDMAVAGDVMIGLGVVAAAAGAVFFFVEQRLLGGEPNAAKKKKKAGIDFGILPGGFSIQGRF